MRVSEITRPCRSSISQSSLALLTSTNPDPSVLNFRLSTLDVVPPFQTRHHVKRNIMFALPFLVLSTLLYTASPKSYDAVCDGFYGRPSFRSCNSLLLEPRERRDRFMGVPLVIDKPRPAGVSRAAWELRFTLPWVRGRADCNIALLSVFKPDDGSFTWRVDNLQSIARTETSTSGIAGLGGILHRCITLKGMGGFRQVSAFDPVSTSDLFNGLCQD